MARPAKNVQNPSITERMEAVFWELLRQDGFRHLSVSSIVKKVPCNRTTFYYYYEDIEDMAVKLITQSMPSQLPQLALLWLSGEKTKIEMNEEMIQSLEHLSMLIGSGGSVPIRDLIEQKFIEMWMQQFQIKETVDEDIRLTLEFLASGLTGIISRYGHPLDRSKIARCARITSELYTEVTLKFIRTVTDRT